MRQVTYSLYMLPGRPPKGKPYKSSWKMNAAEAAAIGALYPIPGTAEHRDIPETEDEAKQRQFSHLSAGQGGARPTPKA